MIRVTFASPLRVERIDGGQWKLLSAFHVDVDDERIVVPAGFVTDFASVPRLPLAYYIAGGRGVKSATLHDHLYTEKREREWADRVLREALVAEGEPRLIADAMYAAVRAGGGSHYDSSAPLEVFTVDSAPPV